MADIIHTDLLSDILAFCEANGLSRGEFGKRAMNDPRFVYDIQAGRECRRATIGKARAFMAEKGDAA